MSKRQQTTLLMTLDDLVAADHPYRKLDALLSFDGLSALGQHDKRGTNMLDTGAPFHEVYETKTEPGG